MKKVKKTTALLLSILMMFPTQSMTIFADTEESPAPSAAEETIQAETAEGEPETVERIDEILPIKPLTIWNDTIIYWNPGGELPAKPASGSNAWKASASNAQKGRDSADGTSPEHPVKSLARALEQAEKMQEDLDIEASEITIYAMSPMEIADGQLYVLNGANIRIASWPGRTYDNDTVFYINGGQLTLINTLLESGIQERDPEETQLVTVYGGILQLGQIVEINGQIVMDYRGAKEVAPWELASASNTATCSNVKYGDEVSYFNINDYILNADDKSIELIQDTATASTRCKPVIQLLDGYLENSGDYLLEVRADASCKQIELVKTLYADEIPGEEFLDYFTVIYNDETGAEWRLTAEMIKTATIRDTVSEDKASLSLAAAKTLVAARKDNDARLPEGVYLGGIKGSDTKGGTSPDDAVATFERAKEILTDKIIAAKEADDEKADPNQKTGFPPFIYICGNVFIKKDEEWELDYDNSLFLETNVNYRTAQAKAGKTVYDSQVRRLHTFVSEPMISVGNKAEFTTGKIIINGMADDENVNIEDQKENSPIIEVMVGSTATLTGNSRITNNYNSGVDVYGKLVLTGNLKDENKQLLNHHGYYVILRGSGASLEMNGYSRIAAEENVTQIGEVNNTAVLTVSDSQSTKIFMKDNSSICRLTTDGNLLTEGIDLSGQRSEVHMQDKSEIQTPSYGIFTYGSSSIIELADSAKISSYYGIYLYSFAVNSKVSLNKNKNAQDGDSAQIISDLGIVCDTYGATIEMGKNALLQGNGYGTGVMFGSGYYSSTDAASTLIMEDNSRIKNYNYGICFMQNGSSINSPINIVMRDKAEIGQNSYGIGEYIEDNEDTYGIFSLNLEMNGNSRISENSLWGIDLSGNLRTTETAYITLRENASICDNNGGIYVERSGIYPQKSCVVTLDGTSEDMSFQGPSIQRNTDAVYLMGTDQIIKLQGTAILDKSSTIVNGENLALYCYGSMELDGRSQIKGLSYLLTAALPITMTHKVQDPKRQYSLWLAEEFLGQIVVQPDDPENLSGGITDVTDQLEYFIKAGADGMAADKELAAIAPNIILSGDKPAAIYIDGINGDDDIGSLTAGLTPSTPVRSLKRAFELLNIHTVNKIYVVGAIQITGDTDVTGTTYEGADGNITLDSTDEVNFIRYIQPDFASKASTDAERDNDEPAGYNVTDYQGELLSVTDGARASFGTKVCFDGHSQPKIGVKYPLEERVNRANVESKAPLITVAPGGVLNLSAGTILMDNNNTYDPKSDKTGQKGGVLYNSGITIVDGALFKNNEAEWGSGVYQDGTFTINSEPENLAGHGFYLTSENTGTESNQVWIDHIIQTKVAIPDDQNFKVDMDHAVAGRDVVKFLDRSAYEGDGADSEHDHFILGTTVPDYLFLVEAPTDKTVLELQDYNILDVKVPLDIYLVIRRNGSLDMTTKLSSVRTEAAGTDLLIGPEYTITNNSRYDVKVSMTAFENQNDAAGITANGLEKMTLVDEALNVLGEKDLYLAIKGLDSGSTGLTIPETSLEPYDKLTVMKDPAVLGIIPTNDSRDSSGSFMFVGAVGTGFVDKYKDMSFPISGDHVTRADLQAHMDGTSPSGYVNARAKYAMKFRLEIDPTRLYGQGISPTSP